MEEEIGKAAFLQNGCEYFYGKACVGLSGGVVAAGEGKYCLDDVCHDVKPHNSFILEADGSPFPDYSSERSWMEIREAERRG